VELREVGDVAWCCVMCAMCAMCAMLWCCVVLRGVVWCCVVLLGRVLRGVGVGDGNTPTSTTRNSYYVASSKFHNSKAKVQKKKNWMPQGFNTALCVVVLLIAILSTFFLSPFIKTNSPTPSTMATERVLLPTNVIPSKYSVHLSPNFSTFKAPGKAVIDVEVKEATNKVVVHSKEIEIQSVEFSSSHGKVNSTYLFALLFLVTSLKYSIYIYTFWNSLDLMVTFFLHIVL
jgi:hypothetical protein